MSTQSFTKFVTIPFITSLVIVGMVLEITLARKAQAQANGEETAATNAKIYLPLVTSNKSQGAPQSSTPTPTATQPATHTPTATPSPTPSPTATKPTVTLPTQLVGTWFTGNAPLNDFYNPTTGEWRDVNGIGQMYVFANDGSYTYTAFARFQTGSCRSEVSVYKTGVASTQNIQLTMTVHASKTRTVTICPTPHESITEGTQAPVTVNWKVAPNDSGIIKLLLISEGNEGTVTTEFYKLGMADSLVGLWHLGELRPDGFYDPTTKRFGDALPTGSWYEIDADATYRHGEHDFSNPNQQGCVLEAWVYITGKVEVVGGVINTKPEGGTLQYVNSCDGKVVVEDPWIEAPNSFAWKHLDDNTKLVLIQLMPFSEYTFER